MIGGAFGLVLGWTGVRALVAAAPVDLPRLTAIGVDGRVVAFTTTVALVASLLFGFVPALQTARANPLATLKQGGRGATGFGRRLRRGLVVAEVALAVVVLIGAGLMVRSLVAMQRVDLGMRTDHVLSARVSLSGDRYQDAAGRAAFFARLTTRMREVPGVEQAGAIGTVFLSDTPNSTNFSIEGRPDFPLEERIEVPVDPVTPDYFATIRIPLVRGRLFDARDTATSPDVVIVNATMANRFWPGADPVGRRIKYGDQGSQSPWMTIVGVVADTRRTGYDAAVRPETYLPHAQAASNAMTVLLRTAGDPTNAIAALRAVVRDLDPQVPLFAVQPLDAQVDGMLAGRRLNTALFAMFALAAALLAAVGIYGVMAGSVEQRTRELGVRLALGASGAAILRSVLAEGLWLVGLGLALGLVAAVGLARTIAGLLYQTRAIDPATLAGIAVLTIVVALLSTLVPALRAVRVDPVIALRAD